MHIEPNDLPEHRPRPQVPPFTIRAARMGDAGAVGRLLAASYRALLAPDYRPELLAQALPLITRPRADLLAGGTYYLADTGAGLIAAGGWTFHAPGGAATGPGTVGHIRHVATDPGATRCGVGRALLERALFEAEAAGVRRMMCFSTLTAEPFYRALGFVPQGSIAITLAPGLEFPAVQMRRDM